MQSFVLLVRKLSAIFTLLAIFPPASLSWATETTPATNDSPPAPADGRFDLSSSWQPGETQRVDLELEVGGHLTITGQKKLEKLPMSVVAKLAYDETLLVSAHADGRRLRSARQYNTAEAVIRVDKGGLTPQLPESKSRLIVEIEKGQATIFHPAEPLTREQLDLLNIVGNSLAIDDILPTEPVQIGQRWTATAEAITALLGLDAVASCEIDSELTSVEGDLAKVTMQGSVRGAAEGVATEIELKAKYHFNLAARRVTGFNMAVKEKRSIGHVGPGVEVVAKLKMVVKSASTPTDLEEIAAHVPTPENTQLLQEASTPGFRFLADRRWFATNETDKLLVMRYVDRGDLLAQCNITPLALKENPQDPMTLEKYQHEVRQALGKNFGQFTRAGQWTDEAGQRVYRVIVQGQVDTLPIEWRYYLITHPNGQRVASVYTIEASALDRFGEADRPLIDTFEISAKPETATKSVKLVK